MQEVVEDSVRNREIAEPTGEHYSSVGVFAFRKGYWS